mmetsp:Transcript_126097/g.245996  ORF Transcript_126097/g.245996 Transcript_126097/m.245996 type:complete len:84 (-) Transcript_126097:349-600(-)
MALFPVCDEDAKYEERTRWAASSTNCVLDREARDFGEDVEGGAVAEAADEVDVRARPPGFCSGALQTTRAKRRFGSSSWVASR